jgi:hypothetical protein
MIRDDATSPLGRQDGRSQPVTLGRMTRRALIRRAGLLGGMALLATA